jgi:4'-phosphopantetheinyl transferase
MSLLESDQESIFKSAAVEVAAARLDAGPDALRALSAWLSSGERARAARFRLDRDRRRYIVARARLRQYLALRLGMPPQSVRFVYGGNGKPALARDAAAADWRFNVSHCGDLAVFAFSLGSDVGIDLEAIHPLAEADDIAARFFSRRESEAYLELAPRDKPLGFFNCWTRKEAFLKALGKGLSLPLGHFDVSLAPGEPARLLRVRDAPEAPALWRLDSFSPLPGFIAALASRRH